MSEAQLNALRSRLSAMQSADVVSPNLPMAAVLQEGNDLLTLCRTKSVWDQLLAVGVDATLLDHLDEALGAARAAQSLWTVARDRMKDDAQKEREQRGGTLRANLMAAARFHLRADRVALGTLSAIAEGEGTADLIQDLSDLATLIEQRASAFANDKTFDTKTRIEDARSLASEISAGLSSERIATDQVAAVDLRDRAYTYLGEIVGTLREAGRYAFRGDEKLKQAFSSEYLRRVRARRRNNQATETEPQGSA